MKSAVAGVMVLALAGCGGSGSASPTPAPFSIKGSFAGASGKALAIDCSGSGSTTVVSMSATMRGSGGEADGALRDRISSRYRVCNYDRANLGRSDKVPMPRTTGDIADDLAALLKNAGVPGPYLMVGVSAGGLYVQHFAARHPDDVVAVLAMNPEMPADRFSAKAFPLMTAAEKTAELAYARGQNGQGIDYATSAKQMQADGRLTVPLSIIQSYDDCPPDDATCKKLVEDRPGPRPPTSRRSSPRRQIHPGPGLPRPLPRRPRPGSQPN